MWCGGASCRPFFLLLRKNGQGEHSTHAFVRMIKSSENEFYL